MNTDPVVMQASGYVPTKKEIVYKPSEGSEQLRNNIAVISTVPNVIMNAGMAGIIPTVASEVGAAAGGYAGNYAGTKLDEKLGTTYLAPTLSIAGTLLGGNYGYKTGKILKKKYDLSEIANEYLKNIKSQPTTTYKSYIDPLTAKNKSVAEQIKSLIMEGDNIRTPHTEGAESRVFIDTKHNRVIKVSQPHKNKHFKVANHMVDKGNLDNVGLEVTFEGNIPTSAGDVTVVSQPLVKSFEKYGDFSDIYTWWKLRSAGYKRVGPGTYSNGRYKFRDVKGANVGIDENGKFVVFDPEILYKFGGKINV